LLFAGQKKLPAPPAARPAAESPQNDWPGGSSPTGQFQARPTARTEPCSFFCACVKTLPNGQWVRLSQCGTFAAVVLGLPQSQFRFYWPGRLLAPARSHKGLGEGSSSSLAYLRGQEELFTTLKHEMQAEKLAYHLLSSAEHNTERLAAAASYPHSQYSAANTTRRLRRVDAANNKGSLLSPSFFLLMRSPPTALHSFSFNSSFSSIINPGQHNLTSQT